MNRMARAGAWALVLTLGSATHVAQAQGQRSILREFEQAFIDLSQQVRPSVVEISAERTLSPEERQRIDDLLKNFPRPGPHGEDSSPPTFPTPSSTASGFLFDDQGHIVTNNHVVRDSTRLVVELWNGEEREAEVVGQDPDADLAVIKIDPMGLELRPVKLGDSTLLRVGQFAIAMGSPSGLTGSFSYGHVTGLSRELDRQLDPELRFQNFIQTDAAINLGNSGGPLCNIDGEVIGVNVAIVYRANSLGFAIPVDRVKEVVPQLIAEGRVTRGWLGVSIQDLADAARQEQQELEDYLDAYGLPDERGTEVQRLTPGGPAEHAGLELDDVIRVIDGNEIEGSNDLIDTVSGMPPGTVAKVGIWRKGRSLDIAITIGEFPGIVAAQYGRDYLGMYITVMRPELLERLNIEGDPVGYFVVDILKGSPAQEAGIKSGDVILEMAHKDARTLDDLKNILREDARPGKTLLLRVLGIDDDAPRKVYVKVPDGFTFE